MIESTLILTPTQYYETAQKMLEEKDLLGFVSNITSAILLAANDRKFLANATYLQAEGLFKFNQYQKAVLAIMEALKHNEKAESFKLKKYLGISKGYIGELMEAQAIFKELLQDTQEYAELVGVYNNLVWLSLILSKDQPYPHLAEAKTYLDLASEHFNLLPNTRKWKLCNNYSVYYYYCNEYDSAIKMLENSIQYCEERDLPEVYSNLVELYLKSSEDFSPANYLEEYLNKAEVIAMKYDNKIALGYVFRARALVELRDDQLFTALDTLYLSFEYFKESEAHALACECLVQITELMDDYKTNRLKSLKNNLKEQLRGTPYYQKITKESRE